VRCPVELEDSVCSWDCLTIEILEYLLGNVRIWKLDKAVSNWCSLNFVAYKLDICYRRDVVKLSRNVLLSHPGFNIADPKRSCALLTIRLVSTCMLLLSTMLTVALMIVLLRFHLYVFLFCKKL
jgi:hypothetical protein